MQKAIQELLKLNIKSRDELTAAKRKVAKKFNIGILLNSDILKEYKNLIKQNKLKPKPVLEKILRKRAIRTLSGIAPVAVLIKPYPCPGQCVYCPSEKGVPQSYLSNEPAVMRAIRCGYNPYKQVQLRLQALEANGHQPNKIELIIIGGTWSVLPEKYKYWFIANCFKACNDYGEKIQNPQPEAGPPLAEKSQIPRLPQPASPLAKRSEAARGTGGQANKSKIQNLKKILLKEQRKNEKAEYRIIGITLETRPDYISQKELWQMRELGCTRVELGVQAIDDKILKLNKRGHGVAEIAEATKLLKNFGFKITYHIMPGLPGSTPAKDFKIFKKLFSDERFQPDQIKLYPTVVTGGSRLYKWWKTGKYKPYSDKDLQNLIIKCKKIIPPYVRIIRLIRDIPKESIIAGNIITNLRQVMKDKGVKCKCIRCREVGNRKFKIKNAKLKIRKYKASGGQEYFISVETYGHASMKDVKKDVSILYGFCRLRLNSAALIRELHVYGELVPVGQVKKIQHAGLGKRLMKEAEKIAKNCNFKKIIVISGIGAREYYKKLGYKLENTYMVKVF